MSLNKEWLMNTLSLIRTSLFSLSLACCNLAMAQVKVVYHINEGVAQAHRAMGNIRNHLAADPTAKITVVTHGPGIDFLLDGATNPNGESFVGSIGDLASKGVEFKVCNNTLVTRKIAKDRVVMEASVVPSGVAEVALLQARSGFVYLRP
jgi:intracellular sulfur oxidation DsrE/DsrF family protein